MTSRANEAVTSNEISKGNPPVAVGPSDTVFAIGFPNAGLVTDGSGG